jgi:glyceraldehyde 3-phosphate dehydrogenase
MHNLIAGFHAGAWEASLALPELRGRLMSSVLFAPMSGVCAVAMTLRMDRAAALSEVLDSLRLAAQRGTSGSLGYAEDPIVSSDVLGDTRSAVIAACEVTAASEHLFCVPLFYDPETGYASRVLDVLDLIVRKQG